MSRTSVFRQLTLALAVVALAVAVPASARVNFPGILGDQAWSALHLTEATQIPGGVLQPGDYVVRLNKDAFGRTIVQILGPNEHKIYATLLTRVTDTPGTVANEGEFTFVPTENREAKHALYAWTIPGSEFGQEFVYPAEDEESFEVAMNAKPMATVTQVPMEVAEVTPPAPMPAPAVQEPPAQELPTQIAQAQPAPPVNPRAKTLPRSGSTTPTLALAGLLLLLLGAGAVRLAWARSHTS